MDDERKEQIREKRDQAFQRSRVRAGEVLERLKEKRPELEGITIEGLQRPGGSFEDE